MCGASDGVELLGGGGTDDGACEADDGSLDGAGTLLGLLDAPASEELEADGFDETLEPLGEALELELDFDDELLAELEKLLAEVAAGTPAEEAVPVALGRLCDEATATGAAEPERDNGYVTATATTAATRAATPL